MLPGRRTLRKPGPWKPGNCRECNRPPKKRLAHGLCHACWQFYRKHRIPWPDGKPIDPPWAKLGSQVEALVSRIDQEWRMCLRRACEREKRLDIYDEVSTEIVKRRR